MDFVVVRVEHGRVSLAPESVVRRGLRAEAGIRRPSRAARRPRRALRTGTRAPCGGRAAPRARGRSASSAPRCPTSTEPAREGHVEVIAVGIGDVDSEQSIEPDRVRGVSRHDSDRGELGHLGTVARLGTRRGAPCGEQRPPSAASPTEPHGWRPVHVRLPQLNRRSDRSVARRGSAELDPARAVLTRRRWRRFSASRPGVAGITGNQRLNTRYAKTARTAGASPMPTHISANGSSASTAPAPANGSVLRESA